MTSTASLQTESAPIVACTISRDVQEFDLLIEDMEATLGESWGDLGFSEALTFFNQPEAGALEFVAMAIDGEDEETLPLLGEVIAAASARGIKVILIAEDVTPAALHQLLRQGADEFVPYPLPEGELSAAIKRLRQPPAAPKGEGAGGKLSRKGDGDGVILAVQGLAGGVGATTFAVNLAWELATVAKEDPPRVCVLDLDLQYGSVATYLDLPRREAVLEMLTDTEAMDDEVFGQALMSYEDKLQVLTSPADLVPLDLIGPQDVERLLDMAARHFDFVIVDMPGTVVQWTETVLTAAHVYFSLIELEMRSAQNTLRLKRALQSEELPFEKLRFALNRAPRFTDLNGKARIKRMAESLGISIELQLSDGGRQVTQSCDHGTPLAVSASKNGLRRDIAKLAQSLYDLGRNTAEAA
jgi:pilus assembly protein CpaE